MGKHRPPEPRTSNHHLLAMALILAVLIAVAGTLAVVLMRETAAPVAVQTSVEPIFTPVPTTTPPYRTPKEIWASCQAQAQGSHHPGTDAAHCMADAQVGVFISCIVQQEDQCPTAIVRKYP